MNEIIKNIIIGVVGVAFIAGMVVLGLYLTDNLSSDKKAIKNETSTSSSDTTKDDTTSNTESEDGVVAVGSGDVTVDIKVKDYGTITVELDKSAAPISVDNFVKLINEGFYNGLTFHRIMEGFMIQGGDPNGDGTGGSSETIKGEFSSNGVDNPLSHTRGAISMARSSENDSASSQFFIVHKDSTSLDGQYAAFGYVSAGMSVVDKIATDAKPTDDNGTIPKSEQPIIESITVR